MPVPYVLGFSFDFQAPKVLYSVGPAAKRLVLSKLSLKFPESEFRFIVLGYYSVITICLDS